MLSKVQIKTIHSLQHKKYRQKSGRFLAEGIKTVEELLNANEISVEKLYALPSWIDCRPDIEVKYRNLQVIPVTLQELKSISCLNTPQEVLALCTIPHRKEMPDLSGRVTLLLEALRDPGNLGTIIRIADWFGLSQIVCSPDCVDTYNPKTIQASMGSIARVKVWSGKLSELLESHQKIPLFATALKGQPLTRFTKIEEGIIAIGNESGGLSNELLQKAHRCITIPRKGGAESLNAAVATGIICSRLLL